MFVALIGDQREYLELKSKYLIFLLLLLSGCGRDVSGDFEIIKNYEPDTTAPRYTLETYPYCLVENTETKERFYIKKHWGEPGEVIHMEFNTLMDGNDIDAVGNE